MIRYSLHFIWYFVLLSFFGVGFLQAAEVNLYSARQQALMQPLLDRFSQQTRIKVNIIHGKADALMTRIVHEGAHSPADVLLTTDVGRLYRAKQRGILQPYNPNNIDAWISKELRDPEGQWVALSKRARPIIYAIDRVKPEQLSTIEALTDPQWQGRICVRSSNNIYNQSMVASLIAQLGREKTERWAKGLVANFARSPQGGDRDQVKAVAAGVCDLAIVNTYYLAGMLNSKETAQQQAAQQVKIFWPNQDDAENRGVHINISGAAILKHAPNKAQAQALLEFLLTPESQSWYAQTNQEYPVRDSVPWSNTLTNFGTFKAESIALEQLGVFNPEAVRLMDRAGWQ